MEKLKVKVIEELIKALSKKDTPNTIEIDYIKVLTKLLSVVVVATTEISSEIHV